MKDALKGLILFYIERLKERSTWVGIMFLIFIWWAWSNKELHKIIILLLTNLSENPQFLAGLGGGIMTGIGWIIIHSKESDNNDKFK